MGDYIAILDDDDLFLPKKIETQLREMQKMKYLICSSEAYLFNEKYFKENSYPIYHREFYNDFCKSFFGKNYSSMLPEVFNYQLIASHNFIIHSTVIFTRELYFEVGGYESVINGMEDWNLFKKMLKLYPCLHINSPLIYYSYIDRS